MHLPDSKRYVKQVDETLSEEVNCRLVNDVTPKTQKVKPNKYRLTIVTSLIQLVFPEEISNPAPALEYD